MILGAAGLCFRAFSFVSTLAGIDFLSSARDTLQVKLEARLLQRAARLVEHILVNRVLARGELGLLGRRAQA